MPDFTLDELKRLVGSLPDSAPLKQVLSSVIVKAADNPLFQGLTDVAKVRASLENWYDNSMDRVSGWFKTQTQLILLIIGLGVATFFNVDTIAVANNLLENPALRASIAAQAGTVGQNFGTQIQPAAGATPGTAGATPQTATRPTTPANNLALPDIQEHIHGPELP